MMERALIHDKIHYWLLMLIGFCIPLTKELLSWLVVGLVANWIVSGRPRHLLSLGKKKGYVLLFSAYYLMHLVGMMYSENTQFGMSYNHISNASLGDKNPGANSYMINFLKQF